MSQVRAATPDDEEAIVSLWVGLLLYHRSIEKIRPRRWQRPSDSWRANLLDRLRAAWREPEQHAVFVALVKDEIVGFIRTHLDAEGPLPAHIDTLFVAEGHRSTGVGRVLMETAERWCLDRGADEIGVGFIARNEGARRTYERLGYQPFLVTYLRRLRESTGATTEHHESPARPESLTTTSPLPWLLFVTGAPGSGKSSIVKSLLDRTPATTPVIEATDDPLILDADWLLEPTSELTGQDMTTASALWPAYRRVWLRVLEMVARNRRSAALFTARTPQELPAARWPVRVDSCLLDCDDPTRTARLQQRGWPPGEIEEAFADAAALRGDASFIIDTSQTTPQEAAAQVRSWLDAHR